MGAFLMVYYFWTIGESIYTEPAVVQCIHQPQNETRWQFILDFRTTEVIVFFSQMLSITIYIIFCKLYMYSKEKSMTSQQLALFEQMDPFYDLLNNSTNDFLASDNTIMTINTLQITNFIFSLAGALTYKDDRRVDPEWN